MGFSPKVYRDRRPERETRCFSSPRLEELIRELSAFIAHDELAWLFTQCFPNTLDTTVHFRDEAEEADTFIITGDIDAMWLRDSTAQIWPYLPYVREDARLDRLFEGALRRQMRCIQLDPYANAFYADQRLSPWQDDRTEMQAGLHERKWELDSLGWFLRLSHGYWAIQGARPVFGDTWIQSLRLILEVVRQQSSAERSDAYRFQRCSDIATETLPLGGRGNPARPCGLVASGFRPSDDACMFPYHIPANALLAVGLHSVSPICEALGQHELAQSCREIASGVTSALQRWGIAVHEAGPIYAYEVDAYGSRLFMDDANVPSLLSLPYLGFVPAHDPTYRRTRARLWSSDNPYFFQGETLCGIGSPHVGPGYIWPLSIIMFALTSEQDSEIIQALDMLLRSHAGTGFMHEAFHQDAPHEFTRPWFGWANSLFGELILHLYQQRPDILRRKDFSCSRIREGGT